MRTTAWTMWTMVVTGLLGIGLMAGCQQEGETGSLLVSKANGGKDLYTTQSALTAAASCEEAEAEFKAMLTTQMLMQLEQQRRWQVEWATNPNKDMYWGMEGGGDPAPSASPEARDNSQESAENYSETNVQTEGVDEADLVKTDGNLLYTLSGQDLVIVDAWPADQAHEVGRIPLQGTPFSLFLDGTRVAVLSSVSLSELDPEAGSGKTGEEMVYGYWQPATLVTVIDASDPAEPLVESAQVFEGYLVDSRRIGARMYLVQQSYLDLWSQGVQYWADLPSDPSVSQINAAYQELAVQNANIIEALTLSDYMPRRFDLAADGTIDTDAGESVVQCTAMLSSDAYAGSGLLTVVTVDLDGQAGPAGTSVMGDWGNVYASADALYAASTNWAWSWWWETGDEDETEINTHIHKFAFDTDTGVASYVASGTVTGYTLNQFSFDEFQGVLRIATTLPDWSWWSNGDNESESFVTTLEQVGTSLVTLGQVSGLGMGETIQSVRFMGDKGYVVTFRQVDPLYVVDLSDPGTPEVVGELKVPGFSSYMHPLDDTHLLTIGRDGTEDGQVLGLSFQIFDVSDPSDPVQVAKTTLPEDQNGYSWSEAQWDHHAFVYFAHLGLLAIPVTGYNWNWESDESWFSTMDAYFSRLDLYHVSVEDGIEPVGSVSHGSMMPEFTVPEPEEDTYCYTNWSYSDLTQIRRGVFLENFLCSVSKGGIQIHDTGDLDAGPVAEVPFLDPATLQETYGDAFECYSYGY
ncbi:MAG: beta-propeller domain-containing protein [Pseudomonadota bacterium]